MTTPNCLRRDGSHAEPLLQAGNRVETSPTDVSDLDLVPNMNVKESDAHAEEGGRFLLRNGKSPVTSL